MHDDHAKPRSPMPQPHFVPLPVPGEGGFDALTGGFEVRAEGGKLIGGFRVQQSHCNPMGVCHGGKLATVCDVYLAMVALFEMELQATLLPTISLNIDYLAPSPLDAWVEFRGEVLRVTRNTVFVQAVARIDESPVIRTNGVYKRPKPDDTVFDTGSALRRLLEQAEISGSGKVER
jgi:uncharacterized protein (TIGR00369 family)